MPRWWDFSVAWMTAFLVTVRSCVLNNLLSTTSRTDTPDQLSFAYLNVFKTVVISNYSLVIFLHIFMFALDQNICPVFSRKEIETTKFWRTNSKQIFCVVYEEKCSPSCCYTGNCNQFIALSVYESNNCCYFALFSNYFFPNLQILEKSLRTLFETRDLSLVKKHVQRQCSKLMEGRASIQDFTFAKEYRGMKSYKPGACVPALELTR